MIWYKKERVKKRIINSLFLLVRFAERFNTDTHRVNVRRFYP